MIEEEWKSGEKISRIRKSDFPAHFGSVGIEYTLVEPVEGYSGLQWLTKEGIRAHKDYFKLVGKSGPVRTRTVTEIVDGVYDRVKVFNLHGVSDRKVGVRIVSDTDNANMVSLDAKELRAAARVLVSLAEALEESAK